MAKPESTSLAWVFVLAALFIGLAVGVGGMYLFAMPDQEEQAAPPGQEGGGPPPAMVRVGLVEIKTLQHRVPIVGRLEELRRVTVTAEVAGKVTEMAVDQGSPVTGGQTMLTKIDDVWAKLAVRSAEADLAAAEAELAQSRSDLEQLEQLAAAKSAKSKEVEDQRTDMLAKEAALAAAQAARDLAAEQLDRLAIVAPFDGAVSRKLVEVGQWVEPGDGVVEMVSTGQLDAVVDVPERYISALKLGDEVEVKISAADAEVLGEIVAIRPDGLSASRTFPIKVRLEDPEQRLRPGMSIEAFLPIAREDDYITVPRDAVLQTPAGATVWFAMKGFSGGPPPGADGPPPGGDSQGDPPQAPNQQPPEASEEPDSPPQQGGPPMPMAMSEPVEVLFGVGERYAVKPLPGAPFPALSEGTQVVIEGAERLFPTRPLDIQPEAPPASAQAE